MGKSSIFRPQHIWRWELSGIPSPNLSRVDANYTLKFRGFNSFGPLVLVFDLNWCFFWIRLRSDGCLQIHRSMIQGRQGGGLNVAFIILKLYSFLLVRLQHVQSSRICESNNFETPKQSLLGNFSESWIWASKEQQSLTCTAHCWYHPGARQFGQDLHRESWSEWYDTWLNTSIFEWCNR